jgi:hypothetical protein
MLNQNFCSKENIPPKTLNYNFCPKGKQTIKNIKPSKIKRTNTQYKAKMSQQTTPKKKKNH